MTPAGRLMWQCRRGTLELDLILQAFVAHHYPALTHAEQEAFERLLGEGDEQLWAWISGTRSGADPALTGVLERLRA